MRSRSFFNQSLFFSSLSAQRADLLAFLIFLFLLPYPRGEQISFLFQFFFIASLSARRADLLAFWFFLFLLPYPRIRPESIDSSRIGGRWALLARHAKSARGPCLWKCARARTASLETGQRRSMCWTRCRSVSIRLSRVHRSCMLDQMKQELRVRFVFCSRNYASKIGFFKFFLHHIISNLLIFSRPRFFFCSYRCYLVSCWQLWWYNSSNDI